MKKEKLLSYLLLGVLMACTPKSSEIKEASMNAAPVTYSSFTEKMNQEDVVISAHRGDWYRFSENSLPGIKSCFDAGIGVIEIDVQFSQDNVAVLMHDKTLDRTTTGSGLVSDYPLDSLKKLNLRGSAVGVLPYKIPTLEEVLTLYHDQNLYFNIDKVTGDYDRYQKVLQLMEKTGTLDQGIFWAPYSYEDAQRYFGKYLSQTNVVPFITDELIQNEDAIRFIDGYLDHLDVPFVYVCLSVLDEKAQDLITHLKEKNVNLGCAPTWDRMSFGYSDRVSVLDPQAGWGKLKEMGFKFFETNYPFYLQEALTLDE
ncbi:MAG: glycerophosphodiester phosphodiesterase family protein [Cyclobacteriaceae bacterium]